MKNKLLIALVAALLVQAPSAASQDGQPQPDPRRQDAGLRRQFDEVFNRRMKEVLDLSDEQLTRLTQRMRPLGDSLRLLHDREGFIRAELNREARAGRGGRREGGPANQGRIGCLLDEFFKVQRQRLEAREAEQSQLSAFGLTPLQRALYISIHEQVNLALENQIADRRGGPGGPARAMRAGPPPDRQGSGIGRRGGPPGSRGQQFASICANPESR